LPQKRGKYTLAHGAKAKQDASDACNHEETPLFVKSIEKKRCMANTIYLFNK